MAERLGKTTRNHVVSIRLDDRTKDSLETARTESGRSLSGEIQFQLDEYSQIHSAYAILSADREVQRACRQVAAVADHINSISKHFKAKERKAVSSKMLKVVTAAIAILETTQTPRDDHNRNPLLIALVTHAFPGNIELAETAAQVAVWHYCISRSPEDEAAWLTAYVESHPTADDAEKETVRAGIAFNLEQQMDLFNENPAPKAKKPRKAKT